MENKDGFIWSNNKTPIEFILQPKRVGSSSQCFIIPKRQFKLNFGKQYRLKIEELVEC